MAHGFWSFGNASFLTKKDKEILSPLLWEIDKDLGTLNSLIKKDETNLQELLPNRDQFEEEIKNIRSEIHQVKAQIEILNKELEQYKKMFSKNPNNVKIIDDRIENLKNLLSKSEFQSFFSELNDLIKFEVKYQDRFIILSQRYYALKKEESTGVIEASSFRVEKTRVCLAAIEFLNELNEDYE